MPTNKLWLEQTERAAWESVEALRQKLLDADKRIERLAPPVEGWPELLAVLDAAREQHGLSSGNYAALIRELSERLAQLDARSRHVEGELARERV
jgi:phosphoglycolate phosphatase-like HAD superfamily hydrolase